MNKIVPVNEKLDLRRGVDHIGVSACAVVHDGQGKILLQKRGPKARDERGHWDIVGGAVEFGESIEDAISRELDEELCTKSLDMEFLTVHDAHRVNHNDNKTHWIAIVYAVKVDPRKIKIGEPHKISEVGWFNLETLPKPLHSQFPKALAAAKAASIVR